MADNSQEKLSGNMGLSDNQLTFFNDNGYLVIKSLLAPNEVETIKDIQKNEAVAALKDFEAKGTIPDGFHWEGQLDANGQPVLRMIGQPFQRFDGFHDIFSSQKLLKVVSSIIGPEIYLHSSKMMCKPPLVGRNKPWHQDLAYWDDMEPRQVTLWCAIDAATKMNGCIQVIPKSHKNGLLKHENEDEWQIQERDINKEDIVYAEMDPGDVLLLNVLTLHASGDNLSSERRLAAIVNFNAYPLPDDQRSRYGTTTPLPLII